MTDDNRPLGELMDEWKTKSTEEQATELAKDPVYVAELQEAQQNGEPLDYRDWQALQNAGGSHE